MTYYHNLVLNYYFIFNGFEMNTHHNSTEMDGHNDYNTGNVISLVVGFILAASNSITGWLAKVNIAADWNAWFQALMLGVIGSTATFFTNRFWKYITEKTKKKVKEE